MKIKIFLIFILFLIALPIAYADMQGDIYDSSVLVYECDDTTTDSSTYNNDGTTSGTVVIDEVDFKTGTGSCDFDATGKTTFTNNGEYAEMINQTYFFWLKSSNAGYPFTKLNDAENPNINGEINTYVYNSPALNYKMRFKTYTSSLEQSSCDNQGLGLGHWNFITLKIEKVGAVATKYFYVNESECYNVGIGDFGINGDNIVISGNAVTQSAINRIDGFSAVNRSLTTAEISYMFNSGNGRVNEPPTPTTPPDEQTFTITATDTYDGSSLNNLTVTVFNSSNQFNYNTENGTIIISNKTGVVLAFNRSLYNLSIAVNDSGGYFNKSFGSINITDGGNFTPDLYQAVLYITAKDVLNNSVGDFLASVPLQNAQAQASSGEPGIICVPSTNCSGTSILYLRAQNYNITGNKTLAASMPNYGFLNTTSNITINAKDSVNIELEFYSNILTINATSIINNDKILNFDINTVGIDVTFNNIQSTTTGQIQLNLMGGNYNLSFGGVNYSNTYKVININSSDIHPNFTFTPYVYNSVNISIFDEILGRAANFFNSKIVNIELVSDIFSQNYTTTTGTFYADLLSPSDYRITYSSADYGKRDYYFNLENKTHNDIELYLLSNTNSTDVTFTIVDNTGAAIENATINLKRYYVDTNSYRTVAMARTNVEGQGVIDTHFNNAFYQILAEKGSFFTNTIGAKIFTNTLAITIATTPDIFEDLDIVNNVLTNLTFNNNTGVFSYVFNHLAGTNVKGRLLVQRTESGKTETICDNSDISSGATVLCPATIVGDKEYYKATGFIDTLTGNTEYITDVLDFDNWADTVLSTFKSSGVFLSIIFAGTIASLGLASPGISIAMFLVGLLGIVFFGFAPLSITIYISIAIIGGIIIYRLKS